MDGEGEGRGSEEVEVYTLDDWQVFRVVYASAERESPRLTLAKFLKRKEGWSGRRGKCGGRGERISSSREDEVVRAKAIGEHRLIICRSKDVMETAMASI